MRGGCIGSTGLARRTWPWGACALTGLLSLLSPTPSVARCSYDLNGVGYGDNCPYRGPGSGGGYAQPVYVPPPVRQPSPAEIRRKAATALNDQGVALEKQGHTREAIKLYERSLQTDGSDVTRRNLAHASNQLGIDLFKQKNFREALQYFQNAARNSPNDPVIAENLRTATYQFERQQREAREAADLDRAHTSIVNSVLSAPSPPPSAAAVAAAAPPAAGFDFAGDAGAKGASTVTTARGGPAPDKAPAGAPTQANAGAGMDFMGPTAGGAGGNTAAFGTRPADVTSAHIGPVVGAQAQTKYSSASAQAAAAAADPNCVFDGRGSCAAAQGLPMVKPPANSPALRQVADRIARNPKLMSDEQFGSRFAWYRQLDSQIVETRSRLDAIKEQIAGGKGDTVILNAQRQTLENTVKQLSGDQSTARKMMDERAKTLQITLDWPGEATSAAGPKQ